jgi:hypothetical protein
MGKRPWFLKLRISPPSLKPATQRLVPVTHKLRLVRLKRKPAALKRKLSPLKRKPAALKRKLSTSNARPFESALCARASGPTVSADRDDDRAAEAPGRHEVDRKVVPGVLAPWRQSNQPMSAVRPSPISSILRASAVLDLRRRERPPPEELTELDLYGRPELDAP